MVAKLISMLGSGEQKIFPLTEETTTIGRNPSNDIRIDNSSVSGKHARVITILESSFLEDLGSTNGTYVNGKSVKKYALNDGDNIIFGEHQMTYQSHSGGTDHDHQQIVITAPTEVDKAKGAGRQQIGELIQEAAAPAISGPTAASSSLANKEAYLQLLSDVNAGTELVLAKALTTTGQSGLPAAIKGISHDFLLILVAGGTDKSVSRMGAKLIATSNSGEQEIFPLTQETTTIGRSPNNDIHINHLSVSSKHARIINILESSFLEDLNSTNGTYVNGKLVKKHVLNHGDNVAFGEKQMTYQSHSADADQGDKQTMVNDEKTIIIDPGEVGMPEKARDETMDESTQHVSASIISQPANTVSSSSVNKIAYLKLLSGTNAGKELVLTKASTTIRQSGVQLAAIVRRTHGFFLILCDGDSDSAVPRMADREHQLQEHEIINVGGVKMQFYLKRGDSLATA